MTRVALRTDKTRHVVNTNVIINPITRWPWVTSCVQINQKCVYVIVNNHVIGIISYVQLILHVK